MKIYFMFKFFIVCHSIWNIIEKLRESNNVFLPQLFPYIHLQKCQVKCLLRLQKKKKKYLGEC